MAAFLCSDCAMSLCTDDVAAELPGAGAFVVRGNFRRLLCFGSVKELSDSREDCEEAPSPSAARMSAAESRGRSSAINC